MHVNRDRVEAVCMRSDLSGRSRILLRQWSDYVAATAARPVVQRVRMRMRTASRVPSRPREDDRVLVTRIRSAPLNDKHRSDARSFLRVVRPACRVQGGKTARSGCKYVSGCRLGAHALPGPDGFRTCPPSSISRS